MQTPKKGSKKATGTYMAFKNGRVGRTKPAHITGISATYESMDTTGYAKGKKEFTLRTSPGSGMYSDSKINRKDVPKKIAEFKKGASRTITYKKPTGVSAGIKKVTPKKK